MILLSIHPESQLCSNVGTVLVLDDPAPRPRLVEVAEQHPELIFVNKIVVGSEESERSCVADVFAGEGVLEVERGSLTTGSPRADPGLTPD